MNQKNKMWRCGSHQSNLYKTIKNFYKINWRVQTPKDCFSKKITNPQMKSFFSSEASVDGVKKQNVRLPPAASFVKLLAFVHSSVEKFDKHALWTLREHFCGDISAIS